MASNAPKPVSPPTCCGLWLTLRLSVAVCTGSHLDELVAPVESLGRCPGLQS